MKAFWKPMLLLFNFLGKASIKLEAWEGVEKVMLVVIIYGGVFRTQLNFYDGAFFWKIVNGF